MEQSIYQLLVHAAKDKKLKEELKKNPREVILRECGIELPEDCAIEVYENSPTQIYYTLPSIEALQTAEKEVEASQKKFVKMLKDPTFRKRLQNNPQEVLREANQMVPENCQCIVLEEKEDHYYFVIPNQEQADEVSEEQYAHIAGGRGDEINYLMEWIGRNVFGFGRKKPR